MDNVYCYPETDVLINKLGITDNKKLQVAERELTSFRINQLAMNPIKGNFDLKHLQRIHKHIFQDIYSWAGEIRMVNIGKGNTFFTNSIYIYNYAQSIFDKLKKDNFLRNYSLEEFSEKFSYYASELNMLHPFREGNGRSTREFLRCLAKEAGYTLNYSMIDNKALLNAFISSVLNYTDLKNLFRGHFINNVRDAYSEDFIKNASDSVLIKLNDIRLLFSRDKQFLPLQKISKLYKEYGLMIENGQAVENLSKFKLLSESVNDLKIEKCRYKSSSQENIKDLNKGIDKEL